MKLSILYRVLAPFGALLGLWASAAHSAGSNDTSANAPAPQSARDVCRSMKEGAPDQCACILEKARAAGVSDEDSIAVLSQTRGELTPPAAMDWVTYNRVRRARHACVAEAGLAQTPGADSVIGARPNPQPDGTYIGRPVRPTPHSEAATTPIADDPC